MTQETLEWYRQALVDFNNHIFNFFTLSEDSKLMYEEKGKKNTKEYVMPIQDTSYTSTLNE